MNMIKMCQTGHKYIILVSLVLGVLLLETYAHTYISIHQLPQLSENEALKLVPFYYNGSTTFHGSCGRWLAIWQGDKPKPSTNLAYIYLFKTEQNSSLLVQSTDVVVLGIEPMSNSSVSDFSAYISNIFYESEYILVGISYEFGSIGTYEIDFGLRVKVYDKTLLGFLPKEEIRISTKITYYYGPVPF
ncbi:MAG: hypothetical protein JSV51_05140 [Candidatus Bathyarchaeota archaeon]|nr:MAG: hypothetical protein JSV51_05140 [Candidatus Bathyarchaeota archaeon]